MVGSTRPALDPETLVGRIDQALGTAPADLVIAGGRLFDLVTGTLRETDVAIRGDTIVGADGRYAGRETIEAEGLVIVPGFVDCHVHVESSLVTPFEFQRMVLPRGTTTAICDPHEAANVLGADALAYFLEAASELVLDLRVQLSSCVPSSPLETSGAELDLAALLPFADHPRVIGLAELMNYPGVIAKDPDMLSKAARFAAHVDGHAPLVRGRALDAYLAVGVRNDHETTSAEEGREKLAKGVHLFLREGSVAKDVRALAPLLTVQTSPFVSFCTDDRNPLEVEEEGHVDHAVRLAIVEGAPVLAAYRAASWSGARHFGLTDRGLVAPGQRADLVLVSDLEAVRVEQVVVGGRLVEPTLFEDGPRTPPVGRNSVRRAPVTAAEFHVPAPPGNAPSPVIGVVPGKIVTDRLSVVLPRADGALVADPEADLAKVAVLERHGRNGNVGRGFVRGFGLRAGALASSVGHDSHNLCVVGVSDADMAVAVDRLITLQGGFVAVRDGEVLAELALPLAGLVSDRPIEDVTEALRALRPAARALGCALSEPFLQLAFLALPVIPSLKITDLGLVDVDRFALVDDPASG